MTYTALVLVAVPLVAVVDLVVLRTRLLTRRLFWVAYAIVLFFQFVTNGILTALPVVRYSDATILGPRLFFAPVEDVGFGFALVLLTLSTWVWLGRRGT